MMPTVSTARSLAVLLVAATALSGCAYFTTTVPEKKPPKTTLAMLETDLQRAGAQLDATDDSLEEMTTAEEFDVEDAFDDFLENAERMRLLGERLMGHMDEIEAQGKDYFAYPAQQTATLDEQRRAELSVGYQQLQDAARLVRRSYSPYQFDIRSLRNSISNNRRPREVETVSQFIDKAQSDAESLKTALDRALDAINRSKTAIGAGGLAEAPPTFR